MGGSSWPAGSSSTWSTPTRPLPPTVASAALEAGLALGDEGGDPLGGVLGGEQALEGVAFQQQAGFEAAVEAAVDRLLGCPQRQRRALGEAGRRLPGLGVDVAGRVHLVDQPDRVALLRGVRPPGEHQLLGPRGPHQAWQPLGASRAWDDPEQDLRLAEPRVLGREAEVGRQCQLAPAAGALGRALEAVARIPKVVIATASSALPSAPAVDTI